MSAPDAGAHAAMPTVDEAHEFLDALYPATWGLALVALCEPRPHEHRGQACEHPGKRPLASDWNGVARDRIAAGVGRDEHLDRAARHLARGGNVGLAIPRGTLALDVDGGNADVAKLAAALPDCPMQATAKGAHFLVRCDLDLPAQTKVEILDGVRVDLRPGGKAQIVVDPSRHASGALYTWRVELPARVEDLPELPAALHECLAALASGPSRDWNTAAGGAPKGERHDTLKALVARWRAKGATHEELVAVAEGFAAKCRPPMDDADVRALVEWAAGLADARGERLHGNAAPEPDLDVADLALDFAAIRARPRGVSPLPGLLPEEPALVVLVARPKAGKTRLAASIAQAAACGVAPWPGPPDQTPALELGQVAVVSAEETGSDMVRMLDGLALLAQPPRERERWESRLLLYARDPSLDERAAPLLRLDSDGFALVRRLARVCGFVMLDSLSRIKPPAAEEIDNDAMTALLDELHRIATEERAYVLLLHHEGHADRDDPVSTARGASAISAVARVVWHLDRVAGDPCRRRLRVRGNAVADAEITFEVSGPDAQPEGALLYWRPVDPLGGVPLEDVLSEVGSECSTRDLARQIAGCDADEEPPGRARREAALVRERWRREGRVEVIDGPRGAKLLRRIR